MSAPKATCPDCYYPVGECLGHDDLYLIDGGWPPPPLPEGLTLLRTAAEGAAGEGEPPRPAAEPLPGLLVIEWPAPRRTLPCFAEVAVYRLDADYAERPMTGVTSLTLHMSPDGLTAEAETLIGEDGEPAGPGAVTAAKDDSGEYKTAVFRYVVAGMRVREPARG